MPTRRFEFKKGSSAKFWEIELKAKSYQVTFGKIGTPGQTRKKEFDSKPAANEAAEKLIKQKMAKGYREVGSAKTSQKNTVTKETIASSKLSAPSWTQFSKKLEIRPPKNGSPAKKPTKNDVRDFEREHDFVLPPSYVSFAREFGAGQIRRFFEIYVPGKEADKCRLQRVQEARGSELLAEIYGDPEFIERMIPFCNTIGGDIIVWDPERQTHSEPTEYLICVLPRDFSQVVPLVDNFEDFIWKVCLGDRFLEAITEADPRNCETEEWPVEYLFIQSRGSKVKGEMVDV